MRKMIWKSVALAALLASGGTAYAQDKNTVRLLVGFAAGGSVDAAARLLAEELRPLLGRNVLVENRPGAGGRVAAQNLQASPADGSTYLFSPDSWAIFPTITLTPAQLRYDYRQDMAPVARVASYPLGFFASSSSGVTSAQDFAEKVKSNSDLAFYASSGMGSITEFLGVLMSREFGAKMTVVPFKGSSEIKTMLMGGQVAVGIMSPNDVLAEGSKNVRPLGFFTEKRWSIAPNIPTMAEQGINITQGNSFMGLWASSKAPLAERQKMEVAVKAVMETPDFRAKLAKVYLEADYGSAQELDKQVLDLIDYWKPVVEASGFKVH